MAEPGDRSRHTTSFDRLDGDRPALFGKRPHLDKSGREILNTAATKIRREEPEFVEDPDDIRASEVLRYLNRHGQKTDEPTTMLITDLLMSGLDAREAVVWFLYEEAGLTIRDIHNALEGRQRAFSAERARQGERNVKSVISSAADKLGVSVDLNE